MGAQIKLNYLPDIPLRTLVSAEGEAAALGRRSWPLDRGSWSCEGAVEPAAQGMVIPPAVSVPAPSVEGKAWIFGRTLAFYSVITLNYFTKSLKCRFFIKFYHRLWLRIRISCRYRINTQWPNLGDDWSRDFPISEIFIIFIIFELRFHWNRIYIKY